MHELSASVGARGGNRLCAGLLTAGSVKDEATGVEDASVIKTHVQAFGVYRRSWHSARRSRHSLATDKADALSF